jgi:type II secretory pathway component PulM
METRPKPFERQHQHQVGDNPNAAYSYNVWYWQALVQEAMACFTNGEITSNAVTMQNSSNCSTVHSAKSVAQLQNASMHTTSHNNSESLLSSSADQKALVQAQMALTRIQSQIQTFCTLLKWSIFGIKVSKSNYAILLFTMLYS